MTRRRKVASADLLPPINRSHTYLEAIAEFFIIAKGVDDKGISSFLELEQLNHHLFVLLRLHH